MAILDTSIDIKNKDMVKRSEVVAFMGVSNSSGEKIYARMKGFTELTTNKNPKEYGRQYVDEESERTSTIGYASSMSYAFDKYKGNLVTEALARIADMELTGEEATVELLLVDMTTISQSSGNNYTAEAMRREFSVSPSTSGNTTDCMTYSGDLKACGEIEKVTATGSSLKPSKWLQCKVMESASASYMNAVNASDSE